MIDGSLGVPVNRPMRDGLVGSLDRARQPGLDPS